MKSALRFLISFLFVYCPLVCSEPFDPACLYLTWQKNPESTMVIQWLTDLKNEENLVLFRKKGENSWSKLEGYNYQLPQGEPFLLHRVELTGLVPHTDYEFSIGENGAVYLFQTMQSKLHQPLQFIVGGDMYQEKADFSIMEKTNQKAAELSPAFVLIGGDIAYSGHKFFFMPEDGKRWIQWLKSWKKTMVTKENRLIPVIPAIGNHEVNGRFGQNPEQAKFFYALFPCPGPQGYNVLDFGNYMSLFVLDSGHTHPVRGQQSIWLYHALQERQQTPHKFAIYHIPAWPSHGSFTGNSSPAIREAWVPSFELFNLSAAFEHHSHTYKRTFPLRKNAKDPLGVLYLGEGAWGVNDTRKPKTPADAWYLAKTASIRHFILVTIDNEKRLYRAIDQDGKVIDEYQQNAIFH